MDARPGLISVRTEVVRAVMVDGFADAVLRRLERTDGTGDDEERVAHAGRLARELERERFAPARAPCPWLRELLLACSPDDPAAAVADICAELAAAEPLERPSPGDPNAATWRVPGPGGHVRHEVALRAITDLVPGRRRAELKRTWTRGFLQRCCDDELAAL